MSRHRFVRNLDLETELAEDHASDEYDSEGNIIDDQDDGMDDEERAQMASALPVVRSRLKDIRPPITDAQIQDSLWHYWFDVDKTTAWLRKDWEKKGDRGPPMELLPTPAQEPRLRTARMRRKRSGANGPSNKAQAASSTPPLTALQRLTLARKEAATASSLQPSLTLASQRAKPSTSVEPPLPRADSKPVSKLALLAQRRREAATARDETSSPALSTASNSVSTTPSSEAPPIDAEIVVPPGSTRPLSKLQQKMAAARAARAESARQTPTTTESLSSPNPESSPAHEVVSPNKDDMWGISSSPSNAVAGPSTFFHLITSHQVDACAPEQPSLANMHITVRGDKVAAERRVRDAFGPGVESPDDIVLRKRDGRAGTGDSAVTQEAKSSSRTKVVRSAKSPAEVNVESEVAKAEAAMRSEAESKAKATTKGDSTANRSGSKVNDKKSFAKSKSAQVKQPQPSKQQSTLLNATQSTPSAPASASTTSEKVPVPTTSRKGKKRSKVARTRSNSDPKSQPTVSMP